MLRLLLFCITNCYDKPSRIPRHALILSCGKQQNSCDGKDVHETFFSWPRWDRDVHQFFREQIEIESLIAREETYARRKNAFSFLCQLPETCSINDEAVFHPSVTKDIKLHNIWTKLNFLFVVFHYLVWLTGRGGSKDLQRVCGRSVPSPFLFSLLFCPFLFSPSYSLLHSSASPFYHSFFPSSPHFIPSFLFLVTSFSIFPLAPIPFMPSSLQPLPY